MKTPTFLLLTFLLAGLFSCQPGATTDPVQQKTIDSLSMRVAELEKQQVNMKAKAKMAIGFGSPLDNFFNADEFWENTVDVGTSECYKRCADANAQHRQACSQIADCAQRQACYEEALANVTSCVQNCR